MDDIVRSIGDRRDVPAQLDPRAAFDMIDQADDDVVDAEVVDDTEDASAAPGDKK